MTDDLSGFSGFMPMIQQIDITEEMTMINTEGDLVSAHTFAVRCVDGTSQVFSISNTDLMRLFFLVGKVINNR
jgi:hypothetical protein